MSNKGLARCSKLEERINKSIEEYSVKHENKPRLGSTGSRLLSGNSQLYLDVENEIASFHGQKHALLANSGWDLNFGLLSCVPNEDTVILYDELSHNSLIMGIRFAKKHQAISFKHNDINDLETKMKMIQTQGKEALVVVESIYSMDGDVCPLKDLLTVAEIYQGMVIIDEAHSIGVLGEHGKGLVALEGYQSHPNILGVVYTFGKAMGLHGSTLTTSHDCLVPFLVNYCSPIIYSTSLSIPSVLSIQQAYRTLPSYDLARQTLQNNITSFQHTAQTIGLQVLPSPSAIQGVVVPGNENILSLSRALRLQGFNCLPIRAPTVPLGQERLRIVLHSFNTIQEVEALCEAIQVHLKDNHVL